MTDWVGSCNGPSACVEIRSYAGVDPCTTLPMTEAEWLAFVAAVKAGEFDEVVSDG